MTYLDEPFSGPSIRFRTPLRGTAGNLLEVKLSANTTGGVYVNASGFQRQS